MAKISGYGEALEFATKKKVLTFEMFGSYQGEWLATTDAGDSVEIWKGWYGSCSGCDWLEAVRSWDTGEVADDEIMAQFNEYRPFLVIKKHTMRDMDLETFKEIMPANIRSDYADFSVEDVYKALKAAADSRITKHKE